MRSIKLIAFDLDGTLTQHRLPPSEKNLDTLRELSDTYCLIMAGAGQATRIFEQMGHFPIDIIGNYGLQYAKYDSNTKSLKMIRDLAIPCDQKLVSERIALARDRFGFSHYTGDGVEFHPSGCITFPILGTKAKIEDKLSFDPDRKIRRAVYTDIKALFPEYNVFIGGSSSFDMAPRPYNKYYALDLLCKELNLRHDEIAYVGDDYLQGGNDESVYVSDIPFVCVDDYRQFPEIMKNYLLGQ